MHIDSQMMLVTSKKTLAKWIGFTLLTVNNLTMSGQLNVDPPNWWGDLEQGRVEVLVSGAEMGVVTESDMRR